MKIRKVRKPMKSAIAREPIMSSVSSVGVLTW